MRVGLISDIHGNLPALEAVLDELYKKGVDDIICLGDIADPLPQTKDVYLRLKSLQIPILRGNHEDYSVNYFKNPEVFEKPNLRLIRCVAEHLGPEIVTEFEKLPFSMTLPGGLYLCHASPYSNNNSYLDGLSAEIQQSLDACTETCFVSGHRHRIFKRIYRNKTLHSIGSVGLPLNGRQQCEYAIATRQRGHWTVVHHFTNYDVSTALKHFEESGWIEQGAPISWLLYEELKTSVPQIGPFFIKHKSRLPLSDSEWVPRVKEFLKI